MLTENVGTPVMAESDSTVVMIPTSDLSPNDYNPNEMTEAEFEELVAEVRHLKRLPKPVVVYRNGTGFVIVDGEHNWRAAKEVGLTAAPCEIIEADDFELMRQTYKRNQHGTHDKVRLGRMFQQMMELRGLSNRALAEEVHVSEGTIRNALLYAEASALRNDYAFEKMPLADVRFFVQILPRSIRDGWLDAKATRDDVSKAVGLTNAWGESWVHSEGAGANGWWEHKLSCFDRWAEAGISIRRDCCSSPKAFIRECRRCSTLGYWWDRRVNRIENILAYVLPVANDGWRNGALYLESLPIGLTDEGKLRPVLITPDEWADLLKRCMRAGQTVGGMLTATKAGVKAILIKKGLPTEDLADPENDLKCQELRRDAPGYILTAPLTLDDKCELFKLTDEHLSEDELKQAKELTIAAIVEDGIRDLTESFWTAVTQVQMARGAVKTDDRQSAPVKQTAEAVQKWVERCPVRLSHPQISFLIDYLGYVRSQNYQALLEAEATIHSVFAGQAARTKELRASMDKIGAGCSK